MNWYYGIFWLLGLSLWLTPLHSQGKLKDLQQIQLLVRNHKIQTIVDLAALTKQTCS